MNFNETNIRDIFDGLTNLCDKWEPYLDIYDTWFSKFRGKQPRILEIGVYKGGSAELWGTYFGPGTFIVGVDIDPSTKQYETENFKVVIGDAGGDTFYQDDYITRALLTGGFDIVIDDGGHHMQQQINAMKICYPMVKDNGIYLCEDTHTSYYDHWPAAGYLVSTSFVEYSKGLVDVLTEEHQFKGPDGETFQPKRVVDLDLVKLYKKTRAIHFYNSVVVLEKGEQKPFKRIFSQTPPVKGSNPVSGNGMFRINTRG